MKKSKLLISTLLSIVLCVSLIVGATFALFVNEGKTDITVTSGKVNVTATADIVDAWMTDSSGRHDASLNSDGSYQYERGTAVIAGDTVTLTSIMPGDGLGLNIDIVNSSNIKTKYRVEIYMKQSDGELFDNLSFMYELPEGMVNFNGRNPVFSDWIYLDEATDTENGDKITLRVEIELPVTAQDEYLGKATTFEIVVFAVQSNVHVDDPVAPSSTASTMIGTYADANNWNARDQYTLIQMDDVVSLETNTAEGQNGAYNPDDKSWELYQSQQATLTIRAQWGYELVSFTITYSSGDTYGVIKAQDGEVSPENATKASAGGNRYSDAKYFASLSNTDNVLREQYDLTNSYDIKSGTTYLVAGSNVNIITLAILGSGDVDGEVHITDVQVVYRAVQQLTDCEHEWDTQRIEWAWSDDYLSATATIKCKNDARHTISTKATVNHGNNTATCEADGQIVHTATATFNGIDGTFTNENIQQTQKLGHAWDKATIEWTWNGYVSTATLTCTNDSQHKLVGQVEMSDANNTATCTKPGYIRHTATATFEGVDGTFTTYSDEPTTELGHLLVDVDEQAATCTEPGHLAYKECERCHEYFEDTTGTVIGDSEALADWLESDGKINTINHSWSAWETVKEATCTENGQETRKCNACDTTETHDIEAPGHDFDKVWHHDSKGHWHECTVCQAKDEVREHVEKVVEGKDATCTETGLTAGLECEDCGEILKAQETISETGHSWNVPVWNWTVNGATATATVTLTCANDPDHTETKDATITTTHTPAACEADGYYTHNGSVTFDLNGETYTDSREGEGEDAIGHNWNAPVWNWTVNGATATATVTLTCANNSDHTETKDATITTTHTPATCEDAGYYTHNGSVTFAINGATHTDSREGEGEVALDHDYQGQWISDGANGHYQKCSHNAEHHSQPVEHNYSGVEWTDNGDTHSRKCKDCEYVDSHDESWGTWTNNQDGSHTHKCTNSACELTETEYCDLSDWDIQDGTHASKCKVCGYVDESTRANHNFTWTTEAEKHVGICQDCGKKIDHEARWGAWTNIGNATYHQATCEGGCGLTKQENHGWSAVWSWGNSVEDVTLTINCSACKETQTFDYDKLESSIEEVSRQNANCGTDGHVKYTATYTYGGATFNDEHEYTLAATGDHQWFTNSNDSQHWQECRVCQKTQNSAVHTYSNQYVKEGNDHWLKCDGCDYENTSAKVEHSYTSWNYSDNDTHIGICVCGAQSTAMSHNVTSWQYGEKEHSGSCQDCKATITEDHNWDANWSYDDNGHYHACLTEDCAQQKDRANHNYTWEVNSEGKHEGTCECVKTIDHEANLTDWATADGNMHERHCQEDGCDISESHTASFRDDDWKNVGEGKHGHNCQQVAGCTVTAKESHGELQWTHEGDKHWQYCEKCDYTTDKTGHDWRDLANETCPDCGAARTPLNISNYSWSLSGGNAPDGCINYPWEMINGQSLWDTLDIYIYDTYGIDDIQGYNFLNAEYFAVYNIIKGSTWVTWSSIDEVITAAWNLLGAARKTGYTFVFAMRVTPNEEAINNGYTYSVLNYATSDNARQTKDYTFSNTLPSDIQLNFVKDVNGEWFEFVRKANANGAIFSMGIDYVEIEWSRGEQSFSAYLFAEGNDLKLYKDIGKTSEAHGCEAVTNGYCDIVGFNRWVKDNYTELKDYFDAREWNFRTKVHSSDSFYAEAEWSESTSWCKEIGHSITLKQGAVDPTCTEAGTKEYWQCDLCGKYFEDAAGNKAIEENIDSWKVIPATGHTYKLADTPWTWNGNTATIHLVCEHDVEHTLDKAISGDTYISAAVTPATCEAEGYTIYTVKLTVEQLEELLQLTGKDKLADSVNDELLTSTSGRENKQDALGHDWDLSKWVSDGNGNHYRECKNDSTHHNDTTPCKLVWGADDDEHWYSCSDCGYEKIKAEHNIDNEIIGRDANEHWYVCEQEGCGYHVLAEEHESYYTLTHDQDNHWMQCSECSYINESTKQKHDMEWISVDDQHMGECINCDYEVEGYHEYGTWQEYSATQHSKICPVCKDTVYANHNFGESYSKVNDDMHSQTCSDCNYVAETEHTWSDTATKYSDSQHEFTCTAKDCGATKLAAHNYGEGTDKHACICGDWCYGEITEVLFNPAVYYDNEAGNDTDSNKVADGASISLGESSQVSISFNQGTAGTSTRWWNINGTYQLRMYKGSSFTIAVNSGVITKIEFKFGANHGIDADGLVVDGTKGTWYYDQSSVTFTATGSIYIESITIYCTEDVVTHADFVATGKTIAANCVHGKLVEYACTHCGAARWEVEGEPIGVHNIDEKKNYQEAVSATCTKPGNEAYYTCPDCGQNFKDSAGTELLTDEDIVIPALGHSYEGQRWISDNAGHHYQQCVRFDKCGNTSALVDCTYDWQDQDGTHIGTCTECDGTTTHGESFVGDYTKVDDQLHSQKCEHCDIVQTSQHNLAYENIGDDYNHHVRCADECGYEAELAHDFGDETDGRHNCECGELLCGENKSTELTYKNLGITGNGYANQTNYTPAYDGISYEFSGINMNSASMQFRASGSGAGALWNTSAYGRIVKIVITWNNDNGNGGMFLYLGTSASPSGNEQSITSNSNTAYEWNAKDGENFTFFKLTNGSKWVQVDTITVTYEVGHHVWETTGETQEANCAHGKQTEYVCIRCGEKTWDDDGDKKESHTYPSENSAYDEITATEHKFTCSVCGSQIIEEHNTSGDDGACDKCGYKTQYFDVTVKADNATVTDKKGGEFGLTYEANTRVEFKVVVGDGYKLVSVTVNDDVVTADDDGVYSFVITAATAIVVTTESDGETVSPHYVKVASGQIESGEYLIVYENSTTSGYAFDGSGAINGKPAGVAVGILNSTIDATKINNNMRVVITSNGSNYTIEAKYSSAANKYLSYSSGTDFSASASGYNFTISIVNGHAEIKVTTGTTSRAIFYRTGTTNAFAPYATSNASNTEYNYPALYKYIEGSTGGGETPTECTHEGTIEYVSSTATCTSDGLEAHYKCTKCQKTFSDAGQTEYTPKTISALGHEKPTNSTVYTNDDGAGQHYYECGRCSEKIYGDHVYASKAATDYDQGTGKHSTQCSLCLEYIKHETQFTVNNEENRHDMACKDGLCDFEGHDNHDTNGTGGTCSKCGYDPNSGEEKWVLATSETAFSVGDKIIIVAANQNFAMGAQNNTNYRDRVAITKVGNTVEDNADMQVISLEKGTKTNTFAFNVGGSNYLCAPAASSNYVKTNTLTSVTDAASWSISITANGIATVKAQCTGTVLLSHNNSASRFACYTSVQTDISVYKRVALTSSGTTHTCTSKCLTCDGCQNADCSESACVNKCDITCSGNPNYKPSTGGELSTVYTFGTTQYSGNGSLTKDLMSGCLTSGTDILSTLSASTVYWATGNNNSVRLGSGSNSGTITIGLSKQITKVVINCVKYGSDAASLSVNNSTGQSAPSSAGDLTFTLNSPTNNIKITSTKRLCVCSITLYYSE